jgi:hypothetical protein
MININILKNYHIEFNNRTNGNYEGYDIPDGELVFCNINYYINCENDRLDDKPIYAYIYLYDSVEEDYEQSTDITAAFKEFVLQFNDTHELCAINIHPDFRGSDKLPTIKQKLLSIKEIQNLGKYAKFLSK